MNIILAFLFTTQLWAAQDPTDCPETVERRASLQVQVLPSAVTGACYLSVKNWKDLDMVYRSYIISSEGEVMIFSSFGPGDDDSLSGAREYYFFPRPQAVPRFVWNDSQNRLEVATTSGSRLYFDYVTGEITGMDKAQLKVSSDITPKNQGGFEVVSYRGLSLDAGFKVAGAPSGDRHNYSTFRDDQGRTCRVRNDEIFKYYKDDDVLLKFTDSELSGFLKKRCPGLSVQF